ncbi:protein MpTZF [Marchantia polymorpha subsp. ruderalis]|uniref:C3H1-type domain-containing protein n=2 Tax=Marchantia polymorpha TaxID=3197 RepID=A0AAF6BM35_MARPO|nr:hypothetical protein MARPO_0104s0012 [Marchantia polymorpha]BBN13069.1 hypothetical protein Mp_6g00540 [Marchantia polymorpha subsp. ruderalis]|eukprot:PTQ31976.1 hypothetical protein MARPO_0104s0012 [Marchantia polymorpha]
MPGVLLDEQNYPLDSMQPSSFYESLAAFSPPVSHSQAELMRNNSFSGSRDSSSSLSHSAPIFSRSHSAISSSALQGFSNYFSPPTTPKKSDNGFSGAASDLGEDMSALMGDNGDVLAGLNGASASSPLSMSTGSHHREYQADLRTFFGGNSSNLSSPTVQAGNGSLDKYISSNGNDEDDNWGSTVVDVYACDQFRMFEFKVRRCMRGRSHDWTECPFAHPGEKARRRDPRRFHYSGTACPDFRKGSCRRGDACEFAHGVFECWLHPARYRTQPCKDGRNCRRRVCFFAHTPDQLRLLPAAAQAASAAARNGGNFSLATQLPQLSGSYDGSPVRNGVSFDGAYGYDANPAGCVSHCPPSPHGSCQNGSLHGGCGHFDGAIGGNASAHNGHCCASPHMSSPTSTLVGHSPSPPPLSPPLSPSGSPPMSPQSPHHWPNSPGAQSLSCTSSQSTLHAQQAACLQASIQAYPYSQGPSSPLSRGTNSQQAMSAAAAAAAHAHQTQSLTPPAHRRHLDRLNSMPTLSIPQVDHSHSRMLQNVSSPLSSPSSCSPPSPGVQPNSSSLSDLLTTIQHLNLRGSAIPLWVQPQQGQGGAQSANQYSSGPSPLRRCSQSVPCTPTKLRWEDRVPRWEVDDNEEAEPPAQRVESGLALRAKIYGRLGKENRMDSEDAPDLGWVNELVKDERPSGQQW